MNMKLVIADSMEPEVVQALGKFGKVAYQPADLVSELKDAHVLIVRSATKVTAELLEHAPLLKVVARAGVGLDNVDLAVCVKKNIKVLNTPNASSNAVAELTIACAINLLRHVPKAHLQMKNGVWDKKNLIGREISGKTLGIIGFGRIGSMVAEKASALGMTILAYDPRTNDMAYAEPVSLEKLLAESDIITLHAGLNAETKNIINAKSISHMKQGACLINIARGELVDEQALFDACKSGKITAAALDVYPAEPYTGRLLELDNVYFTPHIGASTKEAQLRIGEELMDKLEQEIG